jgi:hypothetical protein
MKNKKNNTFEKNDLFSSDWRFFYSSEKSSIGLTENIDYLPTSILDERLTKSFWRNFFGKGLFVVVLFLVGLRFYFVRSYFVTSSIRGCTFPNLPDTSFAIREQSSVGKLQNLDQNHSYLVESKKQTKSQIFVFHTPSQQHKILVSPCFASFNQKWDGLIN